MRAFFLLFMFTLYLPVNRMSLAAPINNEARGRMSVNGQILASACSIHTDDLHQEIFLKIELACTDNSMSYRAIANDVIDFYDTLTDKAVMVDFSSFDNTLDIEVNGIEVGSYGQREYMGRSINFGTGLALPRFTQAIHHGR